MISIAAIQEAVAIRYDIQLADMTSKRRAHAVSHPRMVAMYLARGMTTLSLPEIAFFFEKDHTTVLHGIRWVEEHMRVDRELYVSVQRLIKKLQGESHDTAA